MVTYSHLEAQLSCKEQPNAELENRFCPDYEGGVCYLKSPRFEGRVPNNFSGPVAAKKQRNQTNS